MACLAAAKKAVKRSHLHAQHLPAVIGLPCYRAALRNASLRAVAALHRVRLADSTDAQMSGKRQFPKLGEYYAKMLAHCPQALTAYGACIKAAIDAGALEQGCCEREFSALKKCFREVRVKR